MSDLAPLVVATIRDKVVSDLQSENEKLRRENNAFKAIEITGPGGAPVYARAQFDQGAYHGNPNLWTVRLQQDQNCPLSELPNVEVRVGGLVWTRFVPAEGFLEEDFPGQNENAQINFFFVDNYWIELLIHGWPEEEWRDAMDDWDPDGDAVMNFLGGETFQPPRNPTVRFPEISFLVSEYRILVDQVPRDEGIEEELEARRAENDFFGTVAERLRQAENEEIATSVLLSRVSRIVEALESMGIRTTGDQYEAVIDLMIELESHLGESLQDTVDMIVAESGDQLLSIFQRVVSNVVARLREGQDDDDAAEE